MPMERTEPNKEMVEAAQLFWKREVKVSIPQWQVVASEMARFAEIVAKATCKKLGRDVPDWVLVQVAEAVKRELEGK